MSFEEHGFLSSQMSDWAQSHSPRAARHIRLALDISEFLHARIYSIPVPLSDCHRRRSARVPIVVLLSTRGAGIYQAIFVLVQRGMSLEAAILCRTLVELMFKCLAIQKEPSAIHIYLAEDEHYRRRMASNLLSDPSLYAGVTTKGELRAATNRLRKSIRATGHTREMEPWRWAKFAGMDSMYRTAYAELSSFVHMGVRRLESMFVLGADREVESFAFEPEVIERVLVCATETTIILFEALAFEFGLDFSKELRTFHGRLKELVEDEERDERYRRD